MNPLRLLVKYVPPLAVTIMHVVDPTKIYAIVNLSEGYAVSVEYKFPERHPLMDNFVLDFVSGLKVYVRGWKAFLRPDQLLKRYLRSGDFR